MSVVIDGEEHELPMNDPPLEMPILSVRNIVRKGNYTPFRDGGSYIKNVKTGHNMRFVGRQGVYFTKVLVKAPSLGKTSESWRTTACFGQPGR